METLIQTYTDTGLHPPEKEALYRRFKTIGMPGNKTEQYRRFGIKPLLERPYELLSPEMQPMPALAERLVIENGTVIQTPPGVSVHFETAFQSDETFDDALYVMSHLLTPTVLVIETADDTSFTLHHRFDRPKHLLPYRICVKTVPNSRVQIFETFDLSGSAESLLLYGIDAAVAEGSTLRWIRSQYGESADAAVVGTHRFDVDQHGALELKTFDFGSAQALHLGKIDLADYAWSNAEHLLMATGSARRGNVAVINHNRPYAKSVQEARSILKDRATGIFDSRIRVGHDARYSSAHQNSKAVLLNDKTFMYAKPQLEIYTDELEASHGSTTGRLDEDALFYLQSRGIAEQSARMMLVKAFADILIDAVEDNTIADRIHADFEAAYSQM